jgi:hypothetical protein
VDQFGKISSCTKQKIATQEELEIKMMILLSIFGILMDLLTRKVFNTLPPFQQLKDNITLIKFRKYKQEIKLFGKFLGSLSMLSFIQLTINVFR